MKKKHPNKSRIFIFSSLLLLLLTFLLTSAKIPKKKKRGKGSSKSKNFAIKGRAISGKSLGSATSSAKQNITKIKPQSVVKKNKRQNISKPPESVSAKSKKKKTDNSEANISSGKKKRDAGKGSINKKGGNKTKPKGNSSSKIKNRGPPPKQAKQIKQNSPKPQTKPTKKITGGGLENHKYADKFGIQSYKDNRKSVVSFKKNTGNTERLDTHHLIEKRFSNRLGQNEKNMPTIVLTKTEHQKFTNAWREAIPYKNYKGLKKNTKTASKKLIEEKARLIYKDYPVILKALKL